MSIEEDAPAEETERYDTEPVRSARDRQPLLGRIAELGWFTANGEVAATRALAMMLTEPGLLSALQTRLGELTGIDLGDVEAIRAESIQEDGGRPDLEGLDGDGRPVLMVEAKFTAALGKGQIRSYLRTQMKRLDGARRGVLVVLVPDVRRDYARQVVEEVLAERVAEDHAPYPSETTVVTWDEWLSWWEDATAGTDSGPDSVAADLVQLRALCLTLGGLVIPPLGAAATGAGWFEKERDFRSLVNKVTAALIPEGHGRLPMGSESGYGPRRYFPSGFRDADGKSRGYAALGVHAGFAAEGGSPLWIRFHRKTSHFEDIRARLLSSPVGLHARRDRRHLWLPLTVNPDLAGPELVEDLVAQVRRTQEALADPPA